VLVVSGLALGIDAAAHEAALECGGEEAPTVAVLGCGADVVYPRTNEAVFRAVARRGLLLSEFAWGVPAREWRFPARNRIMAALSRAVVIVEGAERSGARLTVDYALDLGREVLAVPGEAGRKLTVAPHRFIREGAGLCESADDVLTAIASPPELALGDGGTTAAIVELLRARSDAVETAAVLDALLTGSMTADQVAEFCGLPVHVATALLSEAEVDGLAELETGGVYRLRQA
jgi:DNA processing protein